MSARIRQWLVVAACLLALPCAAQPAQLPDTRPRADDRQLRQALDDIRQRHGVPGLAAAVFDREQVRAFGVGELADEDNPVTPESRFRVGQVSMLFTALLAASLQDDGSMPADAELIRLAPEVDLQNPWSNERLVRLDDLLAHRAGLGELHFRDVFAGSGEQPLLAAINRAFHTLRLEFRPGDYESYSAAGYAIVAYIVEKAGGEPYETQLAGRLFDPLALSASLGQGSGPLSEDSAGHAGRPAHRVPSRPLNFPATGDIWISARDLARVGQLLLNRGHVDERTVLAADAVQWLETGPGVEPLVPGSRRGLRAEEHSGFVFYTQTGALPGFLARFAYSPDLGCGYLVLLNHGDARAALGDAAALLRGQLLAGDHRPPLPPPVDDAVVLDELAGWYRDMTLDHPPGRLYRAWTGFARAARCDDALCFQAPGINATLQSHDASRLREKGRWHPGWRVHGTDAGVTLEGRDRRWRAVSAWQVLTGIALAAFVAGGVLLGTALVPIWGRELVRQRVRDHRQLLPRLLPLAAVLTVLVLQVLLFTVDYPALGQAGAWSIAILVASILAPALAVLALLAALAGFFWKLPLKTTAAALYVALASVVCVVAMAVHDLVAFRTWSY